MGFDPRNGANNTYPVELSYKVCVLRAVSAIGLPDNILHVGTTFINMVAQS